MNNQLVEISFRNQSVQAITRDGVVFVAMRPIVENIGMAWGTQQQKLERQKGKFNCIHMTTVAADGKMRDMLCIPLRKLNGWLFSVNPEKVRPEIKDNLIAYQEECFEVLHDHFTKGEAVHERRQEEVKNSKSLPKRQKTQKPSPHKNYIACLKIQDEITGGIVELNLRAGCMQSLATGLATCLGYRPIGFHSVPIRKDAFEKIA
ncbi:phage antirepressor N-terminal domain-containing protein [Serratia marcescens]|uniref:phage antirepressor N-terminal domain-containing protein n=1 Tax=Serratia marcescens TaxID=615 RepID=UPI003C12B8FE